MHTFKKLPIIIPNTKKKAMSTVWLAVFRPHLPLSHTYLAASTNPGQLGAPFLTGKNVLHRGHREHRGHGEERAE
jgi:hypothetical protein